MGLLLAARSAGTRHAIVDTASMTMSAVANVAGSRGLTSYASAWNTALNPTRFGWGSSILSIASIPVLSAASIGHMVTSAVVKQVDANTFERITEFGGKPDDKKP